MSAQTAVDTARAYYDSDDADRFYSTIWGGDDIHIGTYAEPDEPIALASHRTVTRMAAHVGALRPQQRVLDIGSGYCGAARWLAAEYGVSVTALNLSEVENRRARRLNQEAGVDALIDVIDGSFEDIPFGDGGFDLVWSQDAILHSGRRERVLSEVYRVLKPNADFVFTDPMQSDGCPEGVLQPILERIHLESLGSPRFYLSAAERLGFAVVAFDESTSDLATHYRRVLEETVANERELEGWVSQGYLGRMKTGLERWIAGAQEGHLAWGIFHFRKPR